MHAVRNCSGRVSIIPSRAIAFGLFLTIAGVALQAQPTTEKMRVTVKSGDNSATQLIDFIPPETSHVLFDVADVTVYERSFGAFIGDVRYAHETDDSTWTDRIGGAHEMITTYGFNAAGDVIIVSRSGSLDNQQVAFGHSANFSESIISPIQKKTERDFYFGNSPNDPNTPDSYMGHLTTILTLSDTVSPTLLADDMAAASFAYSGTFTTTVQSALRDFERHSSYEVTKLRYKISIPAGFTGTLRWLEVFTPDDDPATPIDESKNKDYRAMSWDVPTGGTETPVYTIDPLGLDAEDANRAYRHPDVNGHYDVVLFTAELAVDANRDGTIASANLDNSDTTSTSNPFRFWLNDDDDSGDLGGSDIPGQSGNNFSTGIIGPVYGDAGVDGARDLIDWFPVALDIKQLVTALPPSDSVKYKLKQADGALNFVYTNLTREHALDYQRQVLDTGFGPSFDQPASRAPGSRITPQGTVLSTEFLNRVRDQNYGVILVDAGAETTAPLVLSVEKDGNVVAEATLYLSITGVEKMYRHLNLRSGQSYDAPEDWRWAGYLPRRNADADQPSNYTSIPQNFPDTNTTQPWFIFLCGSNVGGQNSRGWESEVFKRLYWSKSKARFLGVSWYGDPYSNDSESVYDYHMSVRNSFVVAPKLAEKINGLSGSKTIAGHSLACGAIAAAITDYGLSVNHVCFVDAAIAREAFDGRAGSDEETAMTPTAWRTYDPRTFASNWNERFSGDARANLTWRYRFASSAGVIHNFYSATEDVLGRFDGDVPNTAVGALVNDNYGFSSIFSYVWVYQEKAKGDRRTYTVPSSHAGSLYGGWGFNRKDPTLETDPVYWKWDSAQLARVIKAPGELGILADTLLRRHPLFEPGWGVVAGIDRMSPPNSDPANYTGPSWIFNLYGSQGNSLAADYANRAQLLAEFVPALTLPTGSTQVNPTAIPTTRQHNVPAEFIDTFWPRGLKSGTNLPEWRHSDMREVAYLYEPRFWDALVSISEQP